MRNQASVDFGVLLSRVFDSFCEGCINISHDQSNAKTVCKALEQAQQKVGKAVMACSDDGTDLRKGVALFCKKHGVGRMFDVVHKIGTFLKKILEKDPAWIDFASAAAEAKRKVQRTGAAHLAPPNQRTKSRFLNIEILVHWGIDIKAKGALRLSFWELLHVLVKWTLMW